MSTQSPDGPPSSQPNPASTEDFYQTVDIPLPEGLATLRFVACRRCGVPVLDRDLHDKFHQSVRVGALGFGVMGL